MILFLCYMHTPLSEKEAISLLWLEARGKVRSAIWFKKNKNKPTSNTDHTFVLRKVEPHHANCWTTMTPHLLSSSTEEVPLQSVKPASRRLRHCKFIQ